MKRKKLMTVVLCLVLMLVLAVAVFAAVGYGSKDDPLITKSYLDKVLRPEIESEMDKEIEAAIAGLEMSDKSGDFTALSLEAGQSIVCEPGCEILHRAGELRSEASLADTTTGQSAGVGSLLEANHLYIALEETTLRAETEVTLLIKGAYEIN